MLNLLLIICGFIVGYVVRELVFIYEIQQAKKALSKMLSNISERRRLDSRNVKIVNENNQELIRLRHELYDGCHYFYEFDSNNFVCQGKTLEDCAKNFAVVRSDSAMAMFKNNVTHQIDCFVKGKHSNATIIE